MFCNLQNVRLMSCGCTPVYFCQLCLSDFCCSIIENLHFVCCCQHKIRVTCSRNVIVHVWQVFRSSVPLLARVCSADSTDFRPDSSALCDTNPPLLSLSLCAGTPNISQSTQCVSMWCQGCSVCVDGFSVTSAFGCPTLGNVKAWIVLYSFLQWNENIM